MSRIDQLNSLLLNMPNDAFLQHALALEHIKIGDDQTAKTLFTLILKSYPDYIGSYYHFGKLLERNNQIEEATKIYNLGMIQAKLAKDNHAYNELQAALEDIED